MANLHVATVVSSAFTKTLVYDFKSADSIESILIEDEFCTTIPDEVYIGDGGGEERPYQRPFLVRRRHHQAVPLPSAWR